MSRRNPTSKRELPSKLESSLDDDQLAQVVAWLFAGRTYRHIRDQVKQRYGLTCSIMAVQTLWRRYASREREMREARILKKARLLLQVSSSGGDA